MTDNTDTIKPARIDLGDGDSLNLYRMSDYTTVVRFHGGNPNVQLSSAEVSTVALRAALDEVAPRGPLEAAADRVVKLVSAGSYTRTDEDGLTLLMVQQQRDQATARARKVERERDEARATACLDQDAHWRLDEAVETIQQLARERDEARATAALWKEATREHVGRSRTALSWAEMREESARTSNARAEKAEKALAEMTAHRDKCRDIAMQWQVEANRLRAAEPRPLTPDAITDEMVERALDAADRYEAVVINKAIIREALTAALTEPPARPEGAEGWDEELGEMPAAQDLTPEQRTRLADALAERDRALGIRVTEDGAA